MSGRQRADPLLRSATAAVAGVLAATGAWIVTATLLVPRGRVDVVLRSADRFVDRLFRLVLGPVRSYARRDAVLAAHGPAVLVTQLMLWVAAFDVAYALMLVPATADPGRTLRQVTSSMLTLGFVAPQGALGSRRGRRRGADRPRRGGAAGGAGRRGAHTVGVDVESGPRPDDPVELPYTEFERAYDHLVVVGYPVERSAREAWPHFKGWRVSYEGAAYRLAWILDAVPAPWSGPRRGGIGEISARCPLNRTPDDPEGALLQSSAPF